MDANEQERHDVVGRREQWKRHQSKADATRLIFIDERWAKTDMTRLPGCCPKGRRLVARVPHDQCKTRTFVAALRCDAIVAPCIFDRPINARSFPAWVTEILVPTLKRGDVVVMDNPSSHKAAAM